MNIPACNGMRLDTWVFYFLNSFAFQRDWLDWLIVFRAEYAQYVVWVSVLLFWVVTFFRRFRHYHKKNLELVLFAFVSAVVARFGVGEILYALYNRPRPFEVLPNVYQLFFHTAGHAFPSGHALFFFALATAIYFYYPKTSMLFFLAALSITTARVMAGVHWPSDIVAGAIIGILTAYACHYILRHYTRYRSARACIQNIKIL